MDETSGIAVSVYDSPAQEEAECTASPAPVTAKSRGRKKQVVAKRMQKTFASTSMLANFLPTGTLLTFEMLLPAVSRDGLCTPVAVTMTHSLLLLCSFSCFLFHFTDSFRGSDGKLYYGFVTPSGLALFRSGIAVEVPKDDRYRVGFVDFLHAIMSVTVFLAIAFSDHRVVDCLLPGRQPEMRELMEGIPVIVGAVCSTFFFMFPNTRAMTKNRIHGKCPRHKGKRAAGTAPYCILYMFVYVALFALALAPNQFLSLLTRFPIII